MLNRLDDVDSAVRFGAINRFSSFDFDAEIGERLIPLLADDESISVGLTAADYPDNYSGSGPALESDILWAQTWNGSRSLLL